MLHDATLAIDSGGTIEADYFTNGASSMNVQVCFPAGYEVELADGTIKKIEDFEGGEVVWARAHNKPNGSLQKCKVVRGFKNGVKETMLVRFNNGLELRGTKEHPFYVQGKGWLPLGELAVGDVCYDKEQKSVVVTELIRDGQAVEVYNIEVEGAHTYYIGKNGQSVLVHNECPVCHDAGYTIRTIHTPSWARAFAASGSMGKVNLPENSTVEIPCLCTQKYDIQWIGSWTWAQKMKIIKSLRLLEENIGKLIKEVDDLPNKMSPSDYNRIKEHLSKYRQVLTGINSILEGKDKLRIGQKDFGKQSDSDGRYYRNWGNVSLNTHERYDWNKKPSDELATLLFHEISHRYGTEDDDSMGFFLNAHMIQRRIFAAIDGSLVPLSPANIFLQEMLRTSL